MVCRGLRFDYPFMQVIESMYPVCEQIAVTLFSDDDLTTFMEKYHNDKKFVLSKLEESDFDNSKGGQRLALWKNYTIEKLTTEWNLNLEADEVLHESSHEAVLEAVNSLNAPAGYMIRRFNLWGDPYHRLRSPSELYALGYGYGPCQDKVRRLCKTQYRSNPIGDAESIDIPTMSISYTDKIRTYHMGFVRDRKTEVTSRIHIQEKVYELARADERFYDDLTKNNGEFDPYTRFKKEELVQIDEPLPKVIQQWAKERAYGAQDPFEVAK